MISASLPNTESVISPAPQTIAADLQGARKTIDSLNDCLAKFTDLLIEKESILSQHGFSHIHLGQLQSEVSDSFDVLKQACTENDSSKIKADGLATSLQILTETFKADGLDTSPLRWLRNALLSDVRRVLADHIESIITETPSPVAVSDTVVTTVTPLAVTTPVESTEAIEDKKVSAPQVIAEQVSSIQIKSLQPFALDGSVSTFESSDFCAQCSLNLSHREQILQVVIEAKQNWKPTKFDRVLDYIHTIKILFGLAEISSTRPVKKASLLVILDRIPNSVQSSERDTRIAQATALFEEFLPGGYATEDRPNLFGVDHCTVNLRFGPLSYLLDRKTIKSGNDNSQPGNVAVHAPHIFSGKHFNFEYLDNATISKFFIGDLDCLERFEGLSMLPRKSE